MKRSKKVIELIESVKEFYSFKDLDFSDITTADEDGENLLHVATYWDDPGLIKELIDLGVDVNAYGILGTPLHEAVEKGNIEIVKVLVENGANVHMGKSVSPLEIAKYLKSDEIYDYLNKKIDEKRKNENNESENKSIESKIEYLERELLRLRNLLIK